MKQTVCLLIPRRRLRTWKVLCLRPPCLTAPLILYILLSRQTGRRGHSGGKAAFHDLGVRVLPPAEPTGPGFL